MTISPAPWRYDAADHSVNAADGEWIVEWVVNAGDGQLIAAAPDLLAALRELVTRIEKAHASPSVRPIPLHEYLEPELTTARAALKAGDPK